MKKKHLVIRSRFSIEKPENWSTKRIAEKRTHSSKRILINTDTLKAWVIRDSDTKITQSTTNIDLLGNLRELSLGGLRKKEIKWISIVNASNPVK